jgi:hypothetical protein
MKLTKPKYYDSIEILPLYNFDKYRTTLDLNWFVVGFDGRQTKLKPELLQPIEKIILDEYFKAIDDRSFTNRLQKMGEMEILKTKYYVVRSLISRLYLGFGNNEMEKRLFFVKELAKHGFKMSEINTIDGDEIELHRLSAACEGIKTRISLIEIELKKDENIVSSSMTKQLLIVQIGLQINRINPKEITVSEWVEMCKLLEEKSKKN